MNSYKLLLREYNRLVRLRCTKGYYTIAKFTRKETNYLKIFTTVEDIKKLYELALSQDEKEGMAAFLNTLYTFVSTRNIFMDDELIKTIKTCLLPLIIRNIFGLGTAPILFSLRCVEEKKNGTKPNL